MSSEARKGYIETITVSTIKHDKNLVSKQISTRKIFEGKPLFLNGFEGKP